MKYKDYKKIVLKKDDARVTITTNVWDFTEDYVDESKMSKQSYDIRKLDEHIEDYVLNGFAVIDQIPKNRECNLSRCVRTVDRF